MPIRSKLKSDQFDFAHSLGWWNELWNTSDVLKVEVSEIAPESDLIKKEYVKDYEYSKKTDVLAEELANDKDNALRIFRMVARKIIKI